MSAPAIAIAGGGTGGHLMPGLAVARALQAAGAGPIAFIGTTRGLEARWVPAAGFELHPIAIGGLKSGSAARRLASLAQIPRAVAQSAGVLRRMRAAVVFGIGGYASGPALAAAALLRRPVVVLEVNARTGLANRWASRWVSTAAVNFPQTGHDFRRAVVTGVPVRPEFFLSRRSAPGVGSQVLVTGGSQGAHALNQAVAAMAPRASFRMLHQTGAADLEACRAAYAGLGGRAEAAAFIEDMAGAMSSADLVVCRSGASTLGELAALGKAAILVPFPGAADQHQLHNAQAYAQAGAAVLLEQTQLSPERLAETIAALLAAPERLAAMGAAARQFAHPRAAEEIAALVLGAARSGR
ncbi:MAG: undecaprenyldiphospho-muramoylpentapeptide beta-N-acetylglucosaminyltransferase [Terriglobales bacterium]